MAERHGVVFDETVQVIRPTMLDGSVAELLDAELGSPALEIIRRYSSAGTSVYGASPSSSLSLRAEMTL
ncbi:UTRA domain-containing protein [Aurantimonas sp. VKM B-3413]|uniref:UTRA domain-containing protein n=1 Tax=Aurantimonas sp. VKM B-3413 TaxID=2779401 RepID=UPI00351D6A86|nr:UTRA domain-containing protein [Aurantimonas sp. VKM B-3413]